MAAAAQSAVDFGGMRRPQGQLATGSALEPYPGTLDERSAAHLLRRAGFGGSPLDVRRYAGMSVNAAVESLVRFPGRTEMPPGDDTYSPVAELSQYGPRGLRAMDPDQRKDFNKQIKRQENRSLRGLQVWWLNRMLSTQAPLQEKMAFYFHGHFTTAALRKDVSPAMVYNQNALFRRYALGNLRELTRNVSKDPAMLVYLDGASNLAAHPNENYARELMELFTLGVDNYSEDDVRNSAAPGRAGVTAALPKRRRSTPPSTTTAPRRFSGGPETSPATISSTSSSRSRSAPVSLRPACSARSSTTIRSRNSSTRWRASCAATTSNWRP